MGKFFPDPGDEKKLAGSFKKKIKSTPPQELILEQKQKKRLFHYIHRIEYRYMCVRVCVFVCVCLCVCVCLKMRLSLKMRFSTSFGVA